MSASLALHPDSIARMNQQAALEAAQTAGDNDASTQQEESSEHSASRSE